MKLTPFVLASLAEVASAHYFFDVSAVNGQSSSPFQYIRDFTRPTKYNPIKFSSNPSADTRDNSFIDGEDIICNQGAFTNTGKTEVVTVNAGDVMTFTVGVGASIQHPGMWTG